LLSYTEIVGALATVAFAANDHNATH